MDDSTENGAEPCGIVEGKSDPENTNWPPDEFVDPEPPLACGADNPVVGSPNEVDEEVEDDNLSDTDLDNLSDTDLDNLSDTDLDKREES